MAEIWGLSPFSVYLEAMVPPVAIKSSVHLTSGIYTISNLNCKVKGMDFTKEFGLFLQNLYKNQQKYCEKCGIEEKG